MEGFVGMIFGAIIVACIIGMTPDISYDYEHIAAADACHKNGGYRQIQRNSGWIFVCKDGAQFSVDSIEDNDK